MTDAAEVAHAIEVLAACDHFDESRRAAALLPLEGTIVDLQHAADGCALIARALETRRRTAA